MSPCPSGPRNPGKFIGILQDVTSTKVNTTDLSETERRFMEVLDESPHALYRINYRENKFDYISKGFAQTLGVSREEILQASYSEFFANLVHPEDAVKLNQEREKALSMYTGGKLTFYFEFRLKRADGSYVWVNDTTTLVPDEHGFAYSVGFGADINDRKLLEEELRIAKTSLEEKVLARTAELRRTNRKLTREIRRRKELEENMLRIEEREKEQFGRELHDDIGQRLTSLLFFHEAVSRQFTRSGLGATETWQEYRSHIDCTQQAVRNLSYRLCAIDLNAFTFTQRVADFLAEVSRTARIETHFEPQPGVRPTNQEASFHLFRILQEAVANALKHGKPRNLYVALKGKNGRGEFSIRNDGEDFCPGKQSGRGIGLHSMETRCRLLGGSVAKGKPRTGGMIVRCRIPVQT
jgi:PAS domain S-box-containing protein